MTHVDTWDSPAAPVRRPLGAPRERRVRRAVAITLVAGVIGGLVGGGHAVASVAAAIVVAATAVGVVSLFPMPLQARVLVLGPAVVLVPCLLLRDSTWLLVPNLIAAAAVVGVGLSVGRGGRAIDSAHGYRQRTVVLVRGAVLAPQRAVLGVQAIEGQTAQAAVRGAIGPVGLGVVLAAVVAGVLASGDALFASFFDAGEVIGEAIGRFTIAGLVMGAVVLAGGAAAGSVPRPPFPARVRATPRQIVLVSAPLVVVYVAYIAVQVSAVTLGRAYVTERTGLTWAEYARSGFFQLVAVAVVTFLGLTICRPVLRRAAGRERRTVLALASVAVVCTLAMVVASIVKLDLYADVFGLTMLRLYTMVFAGWLGLAILIAWCSLFRRRGEWVVPVVAGTALLGVFAMNVVDPERVVAEYNLAETLDSPEFDVHYLIGLGDPAVPVLADRIHDLPPLGADAVRRAVCEPSGRAGWLDWNAARAAARDAAETIC